MLYFLKYLPHPVLDYYTNKLMRIECISTMFTFTLTKCKYLDIFKCARNVEEIKLRQFTVIIS